MDKIVDYKIIRRLIASPMNFKEEPAIDKFETEVKKDISEGWQPLGGLLLFDGYWYVQAMVKYESSVERAELIKRAQKVIQDKIKKIGNR